MRLDAHHHLWKYIPEDYNWISENMTILRRDYLPGDLKREIEEAGINATIAVQARQTLEETHWLLDLADNNSFIKGVVGWVPLTSPNLEEIIAPFTVSENVKGYRHVLHDEKDDLYMLRDNFNRGIKILTKNNFSYDILIFDRHLPQTIELVDRHPEQIFILNHIAKPRIRKNIYSPWRERIIELAKRENVYCKISGLVTEADWTDWEEFQLLPYLETILKAFTPQRLMFGSDWPVCLLASSYLKWYQIISNFIKPLSPDEQDRIMGSTAVEAYGIYS